MFSQKDFQEKFGLKEVQKGLPVIDNVLTRYGNLPLGSYLKGLFKTVGKSVQGREDLKAILLNQATPLFGSRLAERLANQIIHEGTILTANHHGLEFFSQTFQARLLFSIPSFFHSGVKPIVPVLACGNVPLDNVTYPQGFLAYHACPENFDSIPVKIPLFSNRLRRWVVGSCPPFQAEMIDQTVIRIKSLEKKKWIHPSVAEVLKRIIREDFFSETVFRLSSYSIQASVLNRSIWHRLFSEFDSVPDLFFFEMERIVRALLEIDMNDPESLAAMVFFDSSLNRRVIEKLDGVYGCWNVNDIHRMFQKPTGEEKTDESITGIGTMFFWGIDFSGKKFPMMLEVDGKHGKMLRGMGEGGETFMIPFQPHALILALKEGRIMPSLFTCFLCLAFARGITCIGGYNQCAYLPKMQEGFIEALGAAETDPAVANKVKHVRTDAYIDGMAVIMSGNADWGLFPAGPLEVIAGGGLTPSDIQRISEMTLREAHIAGMFDSLPDALDVENVFGKGWRSALARRCRSLLKDKVVNLRIP